MSSVIVHPRMLGGKYQYEIRGWLSTIAGEELSAVLMVAEDRFNLLIKLDSPSLIDLGNWQVELKRAIGDYLENKREIAAANDATMYPHPNAEST